MSSSLSNKGARKQGTLKEISAKTPSSDSAILNATNREVGETESLIIEEMRKLCEENSQGRKQTTQTLERLEKATHIKEQLGDHQQRLCELEGRVSEVEDAEARQHRMLRYLLQRDKQLTDVCDNLQNSPRRNNIRIFQIPEMSERGDVVEFVKGLLPKVLRLPPDLDIKIERAHRSLQVRLTGPAAPCPPDQSS